MHLEKHNTEQSELEFLNFKIASVVTKVAFVKIRIVQVALIGT